MRTEPELETIVGTVPTGDPAFACGVAAFEISQFIGYFGQRAFPACSISTVKSRLEPLAITGRHAGFLLDEEPVYRIHSSANSGRGFQG